MKKEKKRVLLIAKEKEAETLRAYIQGDCEIYHADSCEKAIEMLQKEEEQVQVFMSGEGYRHLFQHLNHEKKALYIEAMTDSLTGLYNRRAMERKLETILSGEEGEGVLVMLDLDNFKQINDQFGHLCGDQVLKEIANRIRQEIRVTDLAGRLGGDEFVLFLRGMTDLEEIQKKISRLAEGIRMKCGPILLTGSMGVARSTQDGCDYQTLLKKADEAMYKVKETGKDGCLWHQE